MDLSDHILESHRHSMAQLDLTKVFSFDEAIQEPIHPSMDYILYVDDLK